MKKGTYCRYDATFSHEMSEGALRLYLPTEDGYINYNIAHTVVPKIVCDTWRLSYAFACDDRLANEYPITPNAEWDMAVKLCGRDDFIGGRMHGDEVFTDMRLLIDGEAREMTALTETIPFEEVRVQVDSVGYDPADHESVALLHSKEIAVTAKGVILTQRVEWQNDYALESGYLAMMPPAKSLTDFYYTDVDPTPRPITEHRFEVEGCRSATLFGKESGFSFRMAVPRYPVCELGSLFLMSDNKSDRYNKMYFPVCRDFSVKRGECWESRTEYEIQRKR